LIISPWIALMMALIALVAMRRRLRRTTRRLIRQEHRLRNLFDMVSHAPGMLARMVLLPDGTRRFQYVSPGSRAIYGLTPREIIRNPEIFIALRHPEDRERVARELAQAFEQGLGYDIEHRILLPDGSCRWVRAVGHRAGNSGDTAVYHVVITDVTRQKQIEQALRVSEQRLTLALESAGDGVWDWNLETGHEVFSACFMALYGYGNQERQLSSADFDALTHPDDRPAMEEARRAHLEGRTPLYVHEHRVRCSDGSWKWVLTRGMVIERSADGKPQRMVGTHMDITARKRAEAIIWKQAHMDTLTGLPNRRLFRRRLDELLAAHRQSNDRALALLFLDLDHFKQVNDTLGHEHGDELLCEAARRLQQALGEHDVVARLGGDEFAIILPGRDPRGGVPPEVDLLLAQLRAPVQLAGESWDLSASIGCTWQPAGEALSADVLMRQADKALYAAKAAGRNRAELFTPELHESRLSGMPLLNDLQDGVERDRPS
jgi:diguanylate cyclase (GGDEF)-like protein/PAS domain S-box-containing protein